MPEPSPTATKQSAHARLWALRHRFIRTVRIRDSLLGGLVLGNWILLFGMHQHLLRESSPLLVWLVWALDYVVPTLFAYLGLLAFSD